MIRNYGDFLKICDRDRRGHDWTATNSTELYSQMLWNRQTRLLTAAKQNSGETYATKRLALYLPYAPQTASESPYVDTALFRFEDYSVSSLDRYANNLMFI